MKKFIMGLLTLVSMEIAAQELSVKFLPITGMPWDMQVIYSSPTMPEKTYYHNSFSGKTP